MTEKRNTAGIGERNPQPAPGSGDGAGWGVSVCHEACIKDVH